MSRYNPKVLEPKWQKIWAESKLYEVDTTQKADKKFYIIPMFPYPSGDMHIGHWYNFAPTDTVARWQRMRGRTVLHCNGYDAFGLPAENAAIKRGIAPADWTRQNIASMSKQLAAIGASYDMTKQVITSQPEYYRWTQWLFLKLYDKGLAYKKKGVVNWCPKDQTVLANEQVVGDDNHCERCGTPVIQKELEQWYFKITDYADRLLTDFEKVDWPERVQTMQANWIGKSVGAEIDFKTEDGGTITVFTTRPDTLFGATYMVLAPEHPIVKKITTQEQKPNIDAYIAEAASKTELERKEGEKEKSGVFTGAHAINPVNNEKLPIWIADYVLMGYGTGAIMAVPAHDERDFSFAKTHDLPIRQVIVGQDQEGDAPYTGEGVLTQSGVYDGRPSQEVRERIVKDLAEEGTGKEKINYKMRDWLISRQRYWGTPIPIIYCEDCGTVPVPEDQLPVVLPENVAFEPTGVSPLQKDETFLHTQCPKCSKKAVRETDTMDTFIDSSWYFLRYPNVHNDKLAFDPQVMANWGPVDHYIGGIEHAILHLLYARFITKFLYDHHQLPFEEPFAKLSNQGMILGPDGLKMSKSKGNVVNPDEQVTAYGADSLRLYLMFMGPYDQGGPYNLTGIAGTRRFLERLWLLVQEYSAGADAQTDEKSLKTITHKTIKAVSGDLASMSFNTAIAAMMTMVNELYKIRAEGEVPKHPAWREALLTLTQLLAPFAPHIAEELWEQLGESGSVHTSSWPVHDETLVTAEHMIIAVQVNGKVRGQLTLPLDADQQAVVEAAQLDERIAAHLKDKQIIKEIYVPGRILNLVVKP